jgi:glycosyltransferase involved in cell wall biosynthesis
VFLEQCLDNVSPFVYGIFITSTHLPGMKPHTGIDRIAKKHKANISYFEWVNDFAKARNFNFSQVPKDYTHILWCDADDVFRGLDKMIDLIKDNQNVDAFAFNYLYAFDQYKNPTIVHKKTQLIKNDGSMTWVGRLHEDLHENRSLNVKFVTFIERMHMTTEQHADSARIRNVEISKIEAEENPNDPKMSFNLGNSYFGAGMYVEAKEQYLKFLQTSQSDDEKYVIYQRLSAVEKSLGNKEQAIQYLLTSIGLMYELPDAYSNLGYLYFDYNQLDNAERYILKGLMTKPQYHKSIVYNPRDYDYNPMMALAKVYFNKSRPDLALPMLRGCLKIYPQDKYVHGLVTEMEKETERLEKVILAIQHIDTLNGDLEKIKYNLDKLPEDLQSHPAVCRVRNKYFVKTESTGNDITYYCGQTSHIWNPEMAKTKGIGGSEEAVINLSKEWAKLGYNVTVYNSCGNTGMTCDGVRYEPFWAYNAKDKADITILWRRPNLADYELNTGKLYVDLHDVIPAGEFTNKRLQKIDKVFVKTNSHRILFPNVPDNKIAIIPNGQDFQLFNQKVKKNPYLLVNTSSPERSMDVLPKLFNEVKKQVPQARCQWAYGFDIFDNAHSSNKVMMEWKAKCLKEMDEAGIENMGRLSQKEVAKMYMEGRILAYPSEFYEIDCISVKKAQACGCKPITSDFAAFKESNKYGINIKSKKNKDNWCKAYQHSFGIEDEKAQKAWVDAVVAELKKPLEDNTEMREWTKKFSWDKISKLWLIQG